MSQQPAPLQVPESSVDHAAQSLMSEAERALEACVRALVNFTSRLNAASLEKKVDCGYYLRKAEERFDECRKEVGAFRNLVGKMIAFEAVKQTTMDPTKSLTQYGAVARAVPDIKLRFKLPKKGTDDYAALMSKLKVPKELVERGVFNFDFADASEFLAYCESTGHALLDSSKCGFTEYQCSYYPRKDGEANSARVRGQESSNVQ